MISLIFLFLKGPLLDALAKYWKPLAILLAVVVVYWVGHSNGVDSRDQEVATLVAQHQDFVNSTALLGKAALADKTLKESTYNALKDKADEDNKTASARITTLADQLRDERRSRGSALSPPAPGTLDPAHVPLNRAIFDRALQQFDDEVSRGVEEGDLGITDLNTGKVWAAGVKAAFPE